MQEDEWLTREHELVDAWLREHRKGNLTDHLVDAGFARLIAVEGA